MPVNPDFRDLFFELNAAEKKFLVVGVHAVTFHSVPRYTKDIASGSSRRVTTQGVPSPRFRDSARPSSA